MMSTLNQLVCVWLFYVLNGIILVGLVRVEVQRTSEVLEMDGNKEQTIFQGVVSQMVLWTGTFSERLYIRRSEILKEHSERLLPDAVNTVCRITRGLWIILQENQMCCQLIPIIYFLLSIYVQLYFLVRVGDKIKCSLENLVTRTIPQRCENQAFSKLNSTVLLLLFLIVGLILCIPLRNRYISCLADQEDKLIKEISRQVTQNNIFYLSIKVDLTLVFYSSVLSSVFLLSLSYSFAIVINLMGLGVEHKWKITDNEEEPKTGHDVVYLNV